MVVAMSEGEKQLVLHGQHDVLVGSAPMEASMTKSTPHEDFTCNQCMETFVDRDILFKHVKMEHQQHVHARRRYKCEQCKKTFKSMTGLRNHARTHTTFFETNAESESYHDNNLITRSDTTSSCTINSTFTVESENANEDTNNLHQPLRQSSESDLCGDGRGPRDNGGPESRRQGFGRRRSGIPLPVKRSLMSDDKFIASELFLDQVSPNELHRDAETNSKTETLETCASDVTSSVTRESRRLTRDIGLTKTFNRNKDQVSLFKSRTCRSSTRSPEPKPKAITNTRLVHKSPFGAKFGTVVSSPVLTRNRSRSSKRTPNGKRTPKSGGCTPRIPISGKSTPVKNNARSANKDTPIGKVYNCKKCGKSFVDGAKLEVHFALHVRDTPEKCGVPKHVIKKTQNTQKTDSGLEDCNGTIKAFSCKQCGRTYDKKKFLDAHVKVHDVNTPFSCDCCDKKFRFLSSLKAHSFVHVGESRDISNTAASVLENKAISTCTRGPELNSNDKDAKKINIFAFLNTKENPLDDFLNDLPFTCKSCNFKTRAPAELLNHLKTHSKSERYTCKHCNKSYKLYSNLKMHEKIHTINKLKEILIENTKSKKSE